MQRYKIRTLGKKYGLDRDDLYSYDPQTRAVSYDGRLLTVADDEAFAMKARLFEGRRSKRRIIQKQ